LSESNARRQQTRDPRREMFHADLHNLSP
jgi:hypothetical protein